MTQSDSNAGAFAAGPVDLSKPPNGQDERKPLERLFEQAYFLGDCANLVYPQARTKDSGEGENRLETTMELWERLFNEENKGEEGNASTDASILGQRIFKRKEWEPERSLLQLENDLDDIAGALHKTYSKTVRSKYLYPWRWFSEQRLKEMNEAKRKWSVAHEVWALEAKTRIEGGNPVLESFGKNVKFVSRGGTEYFLAGDEELIILCFRGTEANKTGDVVTDLLAWQTKESQGKAKFHNGFWSALDGVWDELQTLLKTGPADGGFRSTEQPNTQKLWITGHSLGGALATLAAYRLACEKTLNPDSGELPEIGGVFTFGQPRVGDSQFAREYKQLAFPQAEGEKAFLNDRHFRFVNNNDVVTIVPPKPLWIVSVLFGRAWSLAFPAKKNTTSTSASEGTSGSTAKEVNQQWTIEYSDVGRVVLANRAKRLRLLTPDQSLGWKFWKPDFWWPVSYRVRRIGSWRLLSPKRCGGFMQRFLPGIPDHSMQGYVDVLRFERESRVETPPR